MLWGVAGLVQAIFVLFYLLGYFVMKPGVSMSDQILSGFMTFKVLTHSSRVDNHLKVVSMRYETLYHLG